MRTPNMFSTQPTDWHSTFHLLALPFEIRQHLYDQMIALPRTAHINFLCTCKKMYVEAHESFLRRPIEFSSQATLSSLLNRSYNCLRHVHDLHLGLTEIDRDQMSPFLAQVVLGITKLPFQTPYELEIARITSALKLMPNITTFSLTNSTEAGETPAPRLLVNKVLAWAAQSYPELHHLKIDIPNISLESLRSWRHLRSLRITSFSETTVAQAILILEQLTALTELHVVARGRQSQLFPCQDAKRCIDAEVIRRIRPLQVLGIYDLADLVNRRAVFLTADILEAVGQTHGATVRELSLSSISPVEHKTMLQLGETLSVMQHLHTLTLSWPGLEPELLEHLPSTLWSLQMVVLRQSHADDLLETLFRMRQRLPRLRKVNLLMPESWARLEPSLVTVHDVAIPSSHRFEFEHGLKESWTITLGLWHPAPMG